MLPTHTSGETVEIFRMPYPKIKNTTIRRSAEIYTICFSLVCEITEKMAKVNEQQRKWPIVTSVTSCANLLKLYSNSINGGSNSSTPEIQFTDKLHFKNRMKNLWLQWCFAQNKQLTFCCIHFSSRIITFPFSSNSEMCASKTIFCFIYQGYTPVKRIPFLSLHTKRIASQFCFHIHRQVHDPGPE